jgi:hypothetical protein
MAAWGEFHVKVRTADERWAAHNNQQLRLLNAELGNGVERRKSYVGFKVCEETFVYLCTFCSTLPCIK